MSFVMPLLYILIAVLASIILFLRRRHSYWVKRGIPHEKPHPLIGNMHGLRSDFNLGQILAKYYMKFKGSGPFAGVYLGHRPGALLLTREAIKSVLIKDFNCFTDRGLYYNENTDPLTGHLFFVDGDKWRHLRNKLTPTFTSGKMKNMYPTLLEIADKCVEVAQQRIAKDSQLEVRDLLARFTTDVIASVAFGIECNSLTEEDSQFLRMGRKSMEVPRHNAFIMNLIDSFPKFARLLGMRILTQDVHNFFTQTITKTIRYREQHNIRRNDFLNLLMDIKKMDDKAAGKESLSIEEMVAQVYVYYQGGFETSSSAMTLALYELAQNQELQDRLRTEVTEEFEKFGGKHIPYESVMSLQYLDQVISETLRKYPNLPTLNRQAVRDYVMPDNPKFVIEKDTPVYIPVLGIQHDPEFFPNPEVFDPERFDPEIAKHRDAAEFMPFGDGPRNCVGMRFGKMQARLGLATMIYHFKFSVCEKTVIPLSFVPKALILSSRDPVYLRVESVNTKKIN